MKKKFLSFSGLALALCVMGWVEGCANTNKKTTVPKTPKQQTAPTKNGAGDQLFGTRDITPEGNSALHYIDARLYKLRQNDNAALEALKVSVEEDPNSSFLHSELARNLAESNQFEQAILETEGSLKLEPNNPRNHLLRGKLYSVKKESDSAIQEYKTCIKLDPTLEECYTMMIREFILLQRYPEAVKEAQTLVKKDPDSKEGLYYLGTIYAKYLNEPKKAIQIFQRALTSDSEDLKSLSSLGQIYLDEKMFPEALDILLRIERLAPDDIPMKLRIGLLYYELKDYDKAIDRFTKALQLNPDNDRVAYYLGILEAQRQNYEQAITYFQQVPSSSTLFKESILRTALALQDSNQVDRAISFSQKALAQRNDIPELFDLLAALYAKQGNYKKAIEVVDRGLKKFLDQERLLFTKGILLDKMGQADKALAVMEQILKINPDHALALNYIGYTYADKGIRLQEALDLLTKASQIKPEDGYIIDSLAWAYFKSGNKTKALELLQKANQLSPNEPTILEHLGDVYLDMREKDKARGYFQEAVAAAAKEVNPEARDLEDLKRIQSKLGALNP